MVILCLNHNYFPVSEWDYFLFTCQQDKTWLDWGKKPIKIAFSIYVSWRNFFDLRHRMKFTAKYRLTNSHCLMLCERSCILRVQLQQLSGWIFSSATFDSSPTSCQSSSPDGESRFIVPSHQLLPRGRNPPKQSPAAHGALLQPKLQSCKSCSSLLPALLSRQDGTAAPCTPLHPALPGKQKNPKYRCIAQG